MFYIHKKEKFHAPGRDQEVMAMVTDAYCLDISKAKQPKHPLYLKKDEQPRRFMLEIGSN